MEKLPVECLLIILHNLDDIKDLVHCSEINKYFYNITNSDNLWKKFSMKTNGSHQKKTNYFKDEQSSLMPFCYWKWNYIRYERVVNKWERMNGRKYFISPTFVSADVYVGYDRLLGTLVVGYDKHFTVYKNIYGQLQEIQKLPFPKCYINSPVHIEVGYSFIILNARGTLILYKLIDGTHYERHCLFLKKYTDIICLKRFNENDENHFTNFESLCRFQLHGHYLYIFAKKNFIVWDLEKSKRYMKTVPFAYYGCCDTKYIYILSKDRIICTYDIHGKPSLIFPCDMKIARLDTNNELLLAVDENCKKSIRQRKVCAWNKHNGHKLFEAVLNLPLQSNLHPHLNIVVGKIPHTKRGAVEAFSLNDRSTHWIYPPRYNKLRILRNFYGQCNFPADKFIMIENRHVSMDLIDVERGRTSVPFDITTVHFVGFDVMVYDDFINHQLTVQVFS